MVWNIPCALSQATPWSMSETQGTNCPLGSKTFPIYIFIFHFPGSELLFLAGMGASGTSCFGGSQRFLSSSFQSRAHPSGEFIFSHTHPMDALALGAWMDSWSMKSEKLILASSLHPLCRGKIVSGLFLVLCPISWQTAQTVELLPHPLEEFSAA